MPKHISGVGIAGKHTTVIDAGVTVVNAIQVLPNTRITLGVIRKVKGIGKRNLKFTAETISGFSMKITGNCYVQEFWVITSNPREAKRIARRNFNHN